jgi:hypothetical protein
MRALLALALLLSGCSHTYRTHADCNETCKAHGLRMVKVEHGTAGYDPWDREIKETDACRCE